MNSRLIIPVLVAVSVGAFAQTAIPSTSYAGDFRKEIGEPLVKAGCNYLGGSMLEKGCTKVLNTGKDEDGKGKLRARRYSAPQQQQQEQQDTAYPSWGGRGGGGGQPPQYGDSASSQPTYDPSPGYASPSPAYPPPQPVVMGQFCQTDMGVVGPGRPGPVGSLCWVDTHWGRIFGEMITMQSQAFGYQPSDFGPVYGAPVYVVYH
jgi:hypothetical protein